MRHSPTLPATAASAIPSDHHCKMASSLFIIAFVCLSGGLWIGADANNDEDVCFCKKCPDGWTKVGANCYLYESEAKDWADAELTCIEHGANLASVHTKEQYNGIRELIREAGSKTARAWVGGNDAVKEGVWLWSDGSKFAFKYWHAGEPNNYRGREDCMELNFAGGNDRDCASKLGFVCGLHL